MPKTATLLDAAPRIPRRRMPWRGIWLLGPALVAGVAYLDPGNVASNMTAGAKYGYLLVWVVLGVTGPRGNSTIAPVAIGLTLTLVALVAIPISNGSFNPARSIATAIYGGPDALGQLWMSIVAPALGGLIAGATRRVLFDRHAFTDAAQAARGRP